MGITASQKMRLGIFVIIGMVVLGAFIVIPIGMKMSHRTKTYVAFFEHESLQGLEQGASVKFNGVSIGKVQKVSYYPEDINKMMVEMQIADNFPMRVDMHAKTGLIGITGLKYVEISGGTNEGELLKAGGEIQTKPPFFHGIGGRIDTFVIQLETFLSQLNTITDPDSMQAVRVAMDNLAGLTWEAKELFTDVRGVIPPVLKMADSIQMVVDGAVMVMNDIKGVTEVVREGVSHGNIPGLFMQVDSTVRSIKTLTDHLSLTVMQTREDFTITMENMRTTVESANELMRMLAENPSLLIMGDKKERDTR